MPKRRVPKEASSRKKVTPTLVRQMYGLRFNLHYSYERIGKMLYCPTTTVHAALRRFVTM